MLTDKRDIKPVQFEDVPEIIQRVYNRVFEQWWLNAFPPRRLSLTLGTNPVPGADNPVAVLIREEIYDKLGPRMNERGARVGMMVRPSSPEAKVALEAHAADLEAAKR